MNFNIFWKGDFLMFDIPISNNVKPALDMNALASGNPFGNTQQVQPMQNQPMQAQPMQGQPMQAQPMQGQSMQAQPMQVQPMQAQPMQAQPLQSQPMQSQPMQSQSMQSQSMQSQPMQSQPMQSQPMQNTTPVFTNTPRPNGGGVVLAKGQKVSLSKMSAALDLIEVGLGWDVAQNSAIPYDLDVEAFMLGSNGKVLGDDWFIFYNQPMSPDGSCKHLGDNRTGDAVGDDETMQLKLSQVNSQVAKIAFVISINEALQRGHNFGGVQNAYVRVIDKSTNKELIKFNLTDYFPDVTSMTVGELYLKNGEWRFNAVGQGLKTDLAGLCGFYGVNLA